MENVKFCSTCEKANEDCSKEQIQKCLKHSECEHCDGTSYNYPYGRNEGRHCKSCGSEWSVWK